MCEYEAECDWCGDRRIVESSLARQGGSMYNTNWWIIGTGKREGYRGIKWYNRYNDKISEDLGGWIWVIRDSFLNGMPNQSLKKLLK